LNARGRRSLGALHVDSSGLTAMDWAGADAGGGLIAAGTALGRTVLLAWAEGTGLEQRAELAPAGIKPGVTALRFSDGARFLAVGRLDGRIDVYAGDAGAPARQHPGEKAAFSDNDP